jgi:hypothetical protein
VAEILYTMYSFWITGSRDGGVKNMPLLFGALQIAYDNELTKGFAGWSAQHLSIDKRIWELAD